MNDCKFEWSEGLRTGNDTLDIQHKDLILKITYFMEEMGKGNKRAMNEAIAYLTDYVFDHFALEERLMLKTNYPEFEEHRDDHSHYVKYIFKLRQNLVITPELIGEISKELTIWFTDHILKIDMKMAEYLRKYLA